MRQYICTVDDIQAISGVGWGGGGWGSGATVWIEPLETFEILLNNDNPNNLPSYTSRLKLVK